jgi:hypothetical protein
MSATKIDFKRELRELYFPGREPRLVEVPEMAFLMIDGHGDPNTATAYREAIEALYAVAYTTKFAIKGSPGGVNFGVMPLESLWWTPDADKSEWDWTAMIMQPDPVTPEIVEAVREQVRAKKTLPALEHMRFERFDEGLSAQFTYVGPYADEGPAIQRLHEFIAAEGFARAGAHHEIYMSDPRRTAPEKLKTVIRQPVAG